ncbi:MAG: type II toxin-antitoxin system VapC family toxin [Alphaproteobacteria bacterium]|nr:type II toxin-antitoxin system VapC family toxin [Alphaproteobacteria bacterium]
MRLLLDTGVFLWWVTDSPRLSAKARKTIADPGNEILVSAASAWEILIKATMRRRDGGARFPLPMPAADMIADQLARNRFTVLPVALAHALETAALLEAHRDPFDRLLAAQARAEGIPIVTADPAFAGLGVGVVW